MIRIAAASVAIAVLLGISPVRAQTDQQNQQPVTVVTPAPQGALPMTAGSQVQSTQQAAPPAQSPQAIVKEQIEKQRLMFSVTGVPATFPNVLKAAIKTGAVDMTSDTAIDDFAKIEFCDIYKKYHSNEFDWRRVRTAMRKKIDLDKPNYPEVLYLERGEAFGKYDFTTGMLPLKPDNVVNSRRLALTHSEMALYFCGSAISFSPMMLAELSEPLRLDGVELTEEEARAVIAGLSVDPVNGDRIAYGRYTIKISGGEPPRGNQPPRMDAVLQNVTLYEDADYMKPFWTGQTSTKVYRQQEGIINGIPFKGVDPTQATTPDPDKKLIELPAPSK